MRNHETTKRDYGHGLLVAGAYGRAGCAILAARAALRSGCGLVSVHLPQRCVDPMQAAFPEAMVSIDPSPTLFSSAPPLGHYTAIAAGPGLGAAEPTQAAFLALLHQRDPGVPLVLDADAINMLALHPDWLRQVGPNAVLTPHEGEYRRLFGDADAQQVAAQHGITIVRKAHRTRIYAPDGRVHVNHTGNAGMATAGSGDVLTGILLGMLAQRGATGLFDSVCQAVELHGKSGDLAVQSQSQSSLIASDMVENLRLLSAD